MTDQTLSIAPCGAADAEKKLESWPICDTQYSEVRLDGQVIGMITVSVCNDSGAEINDVLNMISERLRDRPPASAKD